MFLALQHLPRGSGGGASAWTYEYVNAVCACCTAMFGATLQRINHIVASNLLDIPDIHYAGWCPIPRRGPIAAGEVWLRLAVCAMEACRARPLCCPCSSVRGAKTGTGRGTQHLTTHDDFLQHLVSYCSSGGATEHRKALRIVPMGQRRKGKKACHVNSKIKMMLPYM